MTIVFVSVISLLILLESKSEKNWINPVSCLMAPYVVIVFLNNIFMYRTGFYRIDDKVLWMVLGAFVAFWLGGVPFKRKPFGRFISECDNKKRFERYHIGGMTAYLYIVGVVSMIKLVGLYVGGQFSAENIGAAEGVMGQGIVAHMVLSSYALIPIIFLYWTYKKEVKYIIPILMIMVATFATLVKYNIIGLLVSVFLFTTIYNKRVLKKAIVLLVIVVVATFVGNYALTFFIHGEMPNAMFYLQHFWSYVGGSLIYDNYIFISGIRVDVSIGYKLMTFLCALPNMFLGKLFDIRFFPHERQNDLLVSSFGKTSNVTDAVGYLFPSQGTIPEVILFLGVMIIIGFLFTGIYRKCIFVSSKFSTFLANFLCYFLFFGFFGTFYINSAPWEILVYSLVLPPLFYKKGGIVWKAGVVQVGEDSLSKIKLD